MGAQPIRGLGPLRGPGQSPDRRLCWTLTVPGLGSKRHQMPMAGSGNVRSPLCNKLLHPSRRAERGREGVVQALVKRRAELTERGQVLEQQIT